MRDLAVLVLHLLATVARLVGPGGARSVVAESVLVKHQRLILNRSRKRSPNLRPADRVVVGLCALFMRPGRLIRSAIVFKASTLLSLHRALIQRKYRWLFSSKGPTRPGPREPRQEVIAAVVDMKQRNPTWGCPRIAHQITLAFGIPINKDALEIEDSQPRLLLAAERSRLIHSRIHTGPMTRTWMPSFVAFVLAAAGVYAGADGDDPKFVVPNVPDLIVKTRETIDLPQSTVRTNTLYFKGAWQRRELYLQFPSALPAQRTVRHATITRCDERRTLELNHDARLYGWSPLNFIGRDVYWGRSRWRERPEPPPAGPEVKITINTVDTGERRQVGSYSARHVITTTTTDPSSGASTRPSESVEDGWHIDLPPAGCWDAGDRYFFASGFVVRPGGAPERRNVEFRGAGRRGFPIEETTRRRGEHEPPITTRVKLIEFSEAVLDKSLFDVPAGYRPALPRLIGRFDMTKPDTVANRLAAYWQDVTTLARDFFRF